MENIQVQILDSTLREGEQTPGVSFKISQKIEIVKLLNRFGVDFIEVGHPVVSKDIYSFIEKVSKLNLNSKIIAHSRLLKKDIDKVIELNVPWVGLFIDVCEECAPLFIDDKKITPKNGKLVIFKDEVHYTSKHKCDHDRIIIAGNIK